MSDVKPPTERRLVCACGTEFVANRNRHGDTARYCSNVCRVRYGQFGRTYGMIVRKPQGEHAP